MPRAAIWSGALLALAAIAAASAAAGEQATGQWGVTPVLVVESRGGNYVHDLPRVEVTLLFGRRRHAPGRITLYVPRGFDLGLGSAPGVPVGSALAYGHDSGVVHGPLAVATLDEKLMEHARSCIDAPPDSALLLRSNVSSESPLPIFVSRTDPADPSGAFLRLDLCPRLFTPGPRGRAEALSELWLSFRGVTTPAREGTYVWRGVVTPLGAAQPDPRLDTRYELRARMPLPHRLTIDGVRDATTKTVLLRGRLRARGRARAGVPIAIGKLDRAVTERRTIFRDEPLAFVRTTRSGTYEVRVPIRRTTGFIAYAGYVTEPCGRPSMAPAGCLSASVAGVESDPVTISVP